MAFFWFFVALILYIMYRRARAKNIENYGRGLRDGYASAEKKISELDFITPESVRAIFETPQQNPPQQAVRQGVEMVAQTTAAPKSWSDVLVESPAQIPQAPQPPQPETREPTPEELQAEKERRTLKNLNALLYVGSFLIVAAMALFVTLTMPATVKLVSLAAVIAAFYIAGLSLHARVERLRPAALAFVGTGLAILPFFGLALTSLGGVSTSVAWFATSVIGIIAYGVAAVRLQSQLVSFLTMAFILSFALSSVSTLGLGMMWYFIVLIGVSLVLNTIHYLAPKSIPQIFTQPVEQTAKIATPVTLIASLVLHYKADLYMYEVLFALGTLHYIVTWLESRLAVYEVLARTLAHITVLLIASDLAGQIGGNDGNLLFNLVWFTAALLQVFYSLLRVRVSNAGSLKREAGIVGATFALFIYQLPSWLILDDTSILLVGALTTIGLLAALVWKRFRQPEWLYLTLAVSVALPFIIGLDIVSPPLEYGMFAVIFTVLGALGLIGLDRAKRRGSDDERMATLITVATAVYAAVVVVTGFMAGDSVMPAWSALSAGVLTLVLSLILRSVYLEAVSAILAIWSIVNWVAWLDISSGWNTVVVVLLGTAVMLIGATLHQAFGQPQRRTLLTTIAALVFAGLVFAGIDASEPARKVAVQLLVVAAAGALLIRPLTQKYRATAIGRIVLGMYVIYPLLALCITPTLGHSWSAATLLIYAAIVWASSHIEKRSEVLWVSNLLLVIGLIPLWHALKLDLDSGWMVFGVAWIAAAVYYLTYWYSYHRKDESRMQISLVSSLLVLIIPAMQHAVIPSEQQWVIASAASLIAVAAVLGVHGYIKQRRELIEAALYVATFGLQRIVWVLLPELSKVFYAHWWAGMLMYVAAWRKQYRRRPVVALALVTASTGLHALEHGQFYMVLFLAEHIIVAIVGAMLRTQWAMWWGIIATIAAVLYFLRDFTFLMLMLLGGVLITFVIWRLLRTDKNSGA